MVKQHLGFCVPGEKWQEEKRGFQEYRRTEKGQKSKEDELPQQDPRWKPFRKQQDEVSHRLQYAKHQLV